MCTFFSQYVINFIFPMGCSLPGWAEKVIIAIAFCSQILSAATYFFAYDHRGYKYSDGLTTGCAPNPSRNPSNNCHSYSVNMGWYYEYSMFCFGIISLFFAIAEVGLLIKKEWFSFVDSAILRSVIYILKGIATLGLSNDLGVASGIIEIIIGAVMLILELLHIF